MIKLDRIIRPLSFAIGSSVNYSVDRKFVANIVNLCSHIRLGGNIHDLKISPEFVVQGPSRRKSVSNYCAVVQDRDLVLKIVKSSKHQSKSLQRHFPSLDSVIGAVLYLHRQVRVVPLTQDEADTIGASGSNVPTVVTKVYDKYWLEVISEVSDKSYGKSLFPILRVYQNSMGPAWVSRDIQSARKVLDTLSNGQYYLPRPDDVYVNWFELAQLSGLSRCRLVVLAQMFLARHNRHVRAYNSSGNILWEDNYRTFNVPPFSGGNPLTGTLVPTWLDLTNAKKLEIGSYIDENGNMIPDSWDPLAEVPIIPPFTRSYFNPSPIQGAVPTVSPFFSRISYIEYTPPIPNQFLGTSYPLSWQTATIVDAAVMLLKYVNGESAEYIGDGYFRMSSSDLAKLAAGSGVYGSGEIALIGIEKTVYGVVGSTGVEAVVGWETGTKIAQWLTDLLVSDKMEVDAKRAAAECVASTETEPDCLECVSNSHAVQSIENIDFVSNTVVTAAGTVATSYGIGAILGEALPFLTFLGPWGWVGIGVGLLAAGIYGMVTADDDVMNSYGDGCYGKPHQ